MSLFHHGMHSSSLTVGMPVYPSTKTQTQIKWGDMLTKQLTQQREQSNFREQFNTYHFPNKLSGKNKGNPIEQYSV